MLIKIQLENTQKIYKLNLFFNENTSKLSYCKEHKWLFDNEVFL